MIFPEISCVTCIKYGAPLVERVLTCSNKVTVISSHVGYKPEKYFQEKHISRLLIDKRGILQRMAIVEFNPTVIKTKSGKIISMSNMPSDKVKEGFIALEKELCGGSVIILNN